MVKYCTHCGAELDNDSEFCTECGKSIQKEQNTVSINKKYLLTGLIAIIIIAIIGIVALTGGNLENAQYIGSNSISIDSVSNLGTEELNPTEYSDYKGTVKGYKVAYTAKSDLKNVSIELQAYDKNGEHIDAMANFMGLNPLNILCYQDNLTAGNSYTTNVVFGSQNITNFEIAKFEVFVYQTTPEETKLIDKFDYNFD
ncbi:MAG: zinc ribbon domain-containing protein [Methanobrevibacter sp.]|nr:zinc ribbon domain-containing protein [Methanobrevibacter sp.]